MKGWMSCAFLLGASLGWGIVIGTTTTDFACVIPILDDAGNVVGTGVLVGKNKVITADHVKGTRTKIGQTTYRAKNRVAAPSDAQNFAPDLAVLCFEDELSQEFYTIDSGAVANNSTLCIVGYGPSSKGTQSPYTLDNDPNPTRREAKNKVDTKTTLQSDSDAPPKKYKDSVYCFDWDAPGTGGAVPGEGITTPNDSGGAMFIVEPNGTKRFVGMIIGGDADTTAKYGDQSYASELRNDKAWIESVPEPSPVVVMAAGALALLTRKRYRLTTK